MSLPVRHTMALHTEWCLLISDPTLCSDQDLGSTGDSCIGKKFPDSLILQRSLAKLLRNRTRERQNREHWTNKVYIFHASYTSGAMRTSKISQMLPLLIIATWQNGKYAWFWLGEECMPEIERSVTNACRKYIMCKCEAPTQSQLST